MMSKQMVSFCNTFWSMIQAIPSVKLNAGGEAIYKFTSVPHLHFYMMSRISNMEGKYEGLQSTSLYKNICLLVTKQSIVRALTSICDECKTGRVVVKGRTVKIVANMFGLASSMFRKVLDKA